MGVTEDRSLLDAREAYERQEWTAAWDGFAACENLGAEDLARMGWSALWTGNYDEVLGLFERAHAAFVEASDSLGAARTALALCQCNWDQRNTAVSETWWRRAAELLDGLPESAEHGLLLWHRGRSQGNGGDLEEHRRLAREAYEIGVRVGSRDVQALGLMDQGSSSVALGEMVEGLSLIDRAAALTVSGDLRPATTGTVYCAVVYACRCRGDWPRAREWTETTNRWVSRTRIAYFPGLCRTHRAEVLRMKGDYEGAERECLEGLEVLRAAIPQWSGYAWAELGEVRRRRGDLAGAMEAFRNALENSWDPQPGLALLMLEQGDARSALQGLDRTLKGPLSTWLMEDMAWILAARVTVAVAAGDIEAARESAERLDGFAWRTGADGDLAAAAYAAAEVELAAGEAAEAVDHLLVARGLWQEMEAPFEMARSRVLLARALCLQEDRSGARLELEAAIGCLDRIGAALELERASRLLAELGDGATAEPPSETGTDEAVFRREGDFWTLSHGGATLRLKDTKGAGYIATLLASPGLEILAADLAAGAGGSSTAPVPTEGLRVAGDSDAGERLDARAAAEYRARLTELRSVLAEAESRGDDAAVGSARAEMEFLAAELASAFGLGGRARKEGSHAERARQSVTKAIRKVIRKVRDEDPDLGRLLDTTIRTGTFCRYEPDPRISWTL